MDPSANLREQADILAMSKSEQHNYDRYRLFDLRCALRDWLNGGGFEPANIEAYADAWRLFQSWRKIAK